MKPEAQLDQSTTILKRGDRVHVGRLYEQTGIALWEVIDGAEPGIVGLKNERGRRVFLTGCNPAIAHNWREEPGE